MTFTINITREGLKKLFGSFAVAAVLVTVGFLSACTSSHSVNAAQAAGQQATLDNYAAVTKNPDDQYPHLQDSVELHNLHERLNRYNTATKISYIYLMSNTGQVVSYYTIKGKVTANGSQMTPTQAVNFVCDNNGDGNYTCDHVITELPEDDLSYGPSEPGVFFFTTDNVMVTTSLEYILSDAPLKINSTTLTIEYIPGSKPTSTGGITK